MKNLQMKAENAEWVLMILTMLWCMCFKSTKERIMTLKIVGRCKITEIETATKTLFMSKDKNPKAI